MVRYKKRYLVVELERVSHVCRDQLDLAPLDVTQVDVTNAVRDKVMIIIKSSLSATRTYRDAERLFKVFIFN